MVCIPATTGKARSQFRTHRHYLLYDSTHPCSISGSDDAGPGSSPGRRWSYDNTATTSNQNVGIAVLPSWMSGGLLLPSASTRVTERAAAAAAATLRCCCHCCSSPVGCDPAAGLHTELLRYLDGEKGAAAAVHRTVEADHQDSQQHCHHYCCRRAVPAAALRSPLLPLSLLPLLGTLMEAQDPGPALTSAAQDSCTELKPAAAAAADTGLVSSRGRRQQHRQQPRQRQHWRLRRQQQLLMGFQAAAAILLLTMGVKPAAVWKVTAH